MKFLKTCRWHFVWMAVLSAVAFTIHSEFPKLDALPRMGAVFVIVAAVIAAVNSGKPIYQNFDGSNSLESKPPLPDTKAEEDAARDAQTKRVETVEKTADRLLMQVPLWAGVGTALWGFGDLIP